MGQDSAAGVPGVKTSEGRVDVGLLAFATLREWRSPYGREGALGPHEPSSVLSYGKETEHGSANPHA
jgi:hypothetical protein